MNKLVAAALVASAFVPAAALAQTAPATYERAVECAAVTAIMLSNRSSIPGMDEAKTAIYDSANSAWIGMLAKLAPDRDPGDRMQDVIDHQRIFNDDPDGVAKATPIAEACVAEVQP